MKPWLSLLVVLAAVAALPLAAPAAASVPLDVELTVSLRDAVWLEPVSVTVTGRGCGNELGKPLALVGGLLQLDLTDLCDIVSPPVVQPFSLTQPLGPLTPGSFRVQAVDPQSHAVLAEAPLDVHPMTNLGVKVHEPAKSDAPSQVSILAIASCPVVDAPEIDGHVIQLDYSSGCNILPPPPAAEEILVDIGPLPPGTYRLQVVERGGFIFGGVLPMGTAELVVHDAAGCIPGDETLCLQGGRFRVEVRWRDFADHSGAGQAVHLAGRRDTGLFWFFHPGNVELTVKALDGCGVNGRHWVFISSGSTVEYTVTVTDTKTGTVREYHNALGEVPSLVADTSAFPTCP